MRILIVDDNKGYLYVISDLLKEHGHEVLLAEDGKQAREVLELEQVELIISDVFMPTLDGVRFHSYVREFTESTDIPFIFISGYDDEYTRNVVQNSEIDFFVSKTEPIESLVDLIDSLMTAGVRGVSNVEKSA